MKWEFRLSQLPSPLKALITAFISVLIFGYGASFVLLSDTTGLEPQGIEENYNGNEDSDSDGPLKFRKSKYEMMNIVHTHAFTLSALFLIMSALVYFTHLPTGLKNFFIVEPLLSIITTFGSILLVWQGFFAFNYVVLISGLLMHGSFLAMILIVLYEIFLVKPDPVQDPESI